MSFSKNLDRLITPGVYARGIKVKVRWGQLIRASVALSEDQSRLVTSEKLVQLDSLGKIRGGIVTRANGYFLVREIPFDQIPARFKMTRGDVKRLAVITDGLDFMAKIEREFLKPVIKGPESLESAFGVRRSDIRLFDVKDDKKALEQRHANGALAYLRRGETVNFKTSEDELKGGIPSLRPQVKNRKPFWYSLQGEQTARTRIVFPEHLSNRYVFTLISDSDPSVIIDKLYLFEPKSDESAQIIHAALNSLFSWYQVELRGRSQLGQGVLELKIPDFAGLLVINPATMSAKQKSALLKAFADMPAPGSGPSFSELGTAARHAFDLTYLKLCGFSDPEAMVLRLEQELRALAGERIERRLSVSEAKVSRRKVTNVAASVDAYATRLAASIEPHPDPRSFLEEGAQTETVAILAPVEGALEVGVELFDQGEVTAGGICVARAGSIQAAQFVRGVLMIQPDLSQVEVPTAKFLEKPVSDWHRECRRWHKKFKTTAEKTLVGLDDPRTRLAVEQRALRLLHAF
ncbi:hypothetical protein [Singulisphaera acidiphila]|uniref:hypothetical protein n=1 Tax=Singulisphaera acidiphila TaxID=466153 RepID=UPI0002471154|nr:hypothetical protein [Singulisphaera acidiphila]